MRKNLIICAAGPNSLHRNWLKNERTFDIFLITYNKEAFNKFKNDGELCIFKEGFKFNIIKKSIEEKLIDVSHYDYIFLPDDDIYIGANDINRLFETAKNHSLDICQPSLSPQNYSHLITVHNPGCLLRFTNFVEIMCPIFSRQSFSLCLPSFDENKSGWGLDYLWHKLLGYKEDKLAVVDSVQAVHTRKPNVQGNIYDNKQIIDPSYEINELLKKYSIIPSQRVFKEIRFSAEPNKSNEINFNYLYNNEKYESITQLESTALKSNPLISVIIPCYNLAQYLPEAVESVVNQTFLEWECMIVNDGSTDNTSEVAEKLIRKYNNFNIKLFNKPNGGLSDARNYGIRHSSGAYFLPLDADDKILPGYLEAVVKEITKEPSLDILYPNLQCFELRNNTDISGEFDAKKLMKLNTLPYCQVIRKKVWLEAGGYNTNMKYGYEDWDFSIKAASAGYKAKHINETFFLYRVRYGSMLTNTLKYDAEMKALIILNNPSLFSDYEIKRAKKIEEFDCNSYQFNENVIDDINKLLLNQEFLSADALSQMAVTKLTNNIPLYLLRFKILKDLKNYTEAISLISDSISRFKTPEVLREAYQFCLEIGLIKESELLMNSLDKLNEAIEYSKNRILLIFSHFYPSKGGMETILENLGENLVEKGFTVEILTGEHPERKSDWYKGMKIHNMNMQQKDKNGVLKWPLIVREYVCSGYYSACLLFADVNNFFVWGLENAAIPLHTKVITEVMINNENYSYWRNNTVICKRFASILKSFSTIISITQNGIDHEFLNEENLPFCYLPNAVSYTEPEGNFRKEYNIPETDFVILNVANLYFVKNQISLIYSLDRLPENFRLVIIGHQTQDQNYCRQFNEALRTHPHVLYIDGLTSGKISSAIETCNLLVLSSWGEVSPVTIVEAMSHKKPWLAVPDCGGANDNAGGIIVSLDYFHEFVKILNDNSELCERLGEVGYKQWIECYTWDNIIDGWVEVFSTGKLIHEYITPSHLIDENNKILKEVWDKYYKQIERKFSRNIGEPLISVIMPAYNHAHLIEESMGSLLNQTFVNFEVIIVNDGSTDNTIEVVERIISKHPYFKIILINQENKGYIESRNIALTYSKGKYYFPLDSDDKIIPTTLEKSLEIIELSDDIFYVYSDIQEFGEKFQYIPTIDYNLNDLCRFNYITAAALIKKVLWEELNGYKSEEMKYGAEDWEFWINAGEHGYFGKKIAEPLLWYRKKSDSFYHTTTIKHDKQAKAKIISLHPNLFSQKQRLWADLVLAGNKEANDIEIGYYMPDFIEDSKPSKINNELIKSTKQSFLTSFSSEFWNTDYSSITSVIINPANAIGDNLMLTALVFDMKKQFDNLNIYIQRNHVSEMIFKNHPSIKGFVNSTDELKYDKIIDYNNIIAKLPEYLNGIHFMDILGNIAGFKFSVRDIVYQMDMKEVMWAKNELKKFAGHELIGIHFTTSKDIKRSYPHGKKLIKELLNRNPNLRFVLLGTEKQSGINTDYVYDSTNQINIRNQIALAGCCNKYISIDSAFFHIGHNLFKKPTLAIMGLTNPQLIGNHSSGFANIRNENLNCLACYWGKDCRIECMNELQPKIITEAFIDLDNRIITEHTRITESINIKMGNDFNKMIYDYFFKSRKARLLKLYDEDGILPNYALNWNGIEVSGPKWN
jgi:glycosyltransferase involved in cell wall biosynthesis